MAADRLAWKGPACLEENEARRPWRTTGGIERMTRRDFLTASAVAAGSLTRLRSAESYPPEKLARIAVLSLNFDNIMKTPKRADDPKRTLDFMDFPDMVAERYGVHWVEPFSTHFASTEPDYLQAFLARVKKAKSSINQISVGGLSMTMSEPDPIRRVEAIDLTKRWTIIASRWNAPACR
jgi:hypothetical protein